jgi:hypothetical protein
MAKLYHAQRRTCIPHYDFLKPTQNLSKELSSAMIAKIYGPIAQLGERLLRKQEAGGSTPPRST